MKNENIFSESSCGASELVDNAAKRDPRVSALMAKLSESDRARLLQVLNDPAQTRSILATPQAQALIRSLQNNGQQKNAGGE